MNPKMIAIALVALASQPTAAQMSAPPIPSVLPKVSSISVANAVGVLKYCEKNGLVSGVSTDAVVSLLPNKPDVKSSDYAVGESGQILGDGGKNYSLSSAPGYLKSQACDMVLQRAKAFGPSN